MIILLKRLRKRIVDAMGKPTTNKAKRRGNSPYHKYGKTPYRYSAAYYDWHRAAKAGKPAPRLDWKGKAAKEFRQAAE